MAESKVKQAIKLMVPSIESSLDAVCILDSEFKIVYANAAMKQLLKLTPRSNLAGKRFCDWIQLSICKSSCRVENAFEKEKSFRFDNIAASRGKSRLRVLIRAVPFHFPGEPKSSKPIGTVITMRDSSGEIIVQAKYHKIRKLLNERNREIAELREKVSSTRRR